MVTIQGSTLESNRSPAGGGILNTDGTLSLTNCTIADNSASAPNAGGGGIYNEGAGTLTVTDCTIARNSASNGGGIFNVGSATLGNTIVADNSVTGIGYPDFDGTVTDSGNNLIGDDSGSSGFTKSSDLLNANPLLSALGNYGGPTQTFALLPGSPAINAGSNALIPVWITTDQRGTGYPRIVNGTVDIGAFESSGFTVSVSSGNNQTTFVGTAFSAPLDVTVVSVANNEPVAGGVVTFTRPASAASVTFPGGSATATISSAGDAGILVTANTITGSYAVGVSASGVTTGTSASVDVGGGIVPDALAVGGNGGSAGAQARKALKPHALRSKARAALATSSHLTTASAGRARAIAQADAARDRVLAELKGNVHAYLMAERLAGGRLD